MGATGGDIDEQPGPNDSTARPGRGLALGAGPGDLSDDPARWKKHAGC